MKLSEIKGERVFDVLADIVEPVVSIAEDKNAAAIFQPQELPKGKTPWEFFLSRIKVSLPSLVRDHKRELAAIMAAVNGVTTDEYMDSVTIPKLMSDLVELVTDQEFTSFFG